MTGQHRRRDVFDATLEQVLNDLPEPASKLLESIPLIVEHQPTAELCDELGIEPRDLLGLYSGIPVTKRSIEDAGQPSEVVHLYRLNLLRTARDWRGQLEPAVLAEEIRITILHELGHHYGLNDEQLGELGY